jgi:hypothetical protein
MRFLRLALVTIERSPIPAGKQLHASYGNIDVETHDTRSRGNPGPVLVAASTVLAQRPQLNAAHEVVIEEGMGKALEQAIVLMADLMSVATRSSRSISSPTPWVALTELTAEDREYLADAVGFESPRMAARNRIILPLALDDPAVLDLPRDRADGVTMMAEGLASSHETGRFHEYIRLFERAFALSSKPLVRPLSTFLGGAASLDYTEPEVRHWITGVRHLATHADRHLEFVTASDVNPILGRVEQAAVDVLFNKEVWRDPSPARRAAYKWLAGTTRTGGLITQGSLPTIHGQLFDGYGTFPLHLEGIMVQPSADWWVGPPVPASEESELEITPAPGNGRPHESQPALAQNEGDDGASRA